MPAMNVRNMMLFLVSLLLLCEDNFSQEWIFTGLSGLSQNLATKHDCSRSLEPGTYRHMLCRQKFSGMQSIKRGTSMAFRQCAKLFKWSPWNCSALKPEGDTDSPFGEGLKGTKEAAFISALFAASVVHAITTDCRDGRIEGCECDRGRHPNNVYGVSGFVAGCSENIKYGIAFSERFIDTAELMDRHRRPRTSKDILSMNIHNYRVGRKIARESMRKICKCHGMSGTCATKVCFKQLPPFDEIAKQIKKKYEHATYARVSRNSWKPGRVSLVPVWPTLKKIGIGDLVYLIPSPNYCNYNKTLGILGTPGRRCKVSKTNSIQTYPEHCKMLCCGRSYYSVKKVVKENCHCKFTWCCNVECKTCYKTKELHFCR